MTTGKVPSLVRKRVLCTSVAVAVAVAALAGAAAAATSAPTTKAASGTTPVTLGAAPLGLDVAPWDTLLGSASTASSVLSYIKAAGIGQLHYGGGGTADQYDWANNTVVNNPNTCGPAPTVKAFSTTCAKKEPLDFADFSADARSIGAQTYATVNYGSGSPTMASDWVTASEGTPGEGVTQWSIGNESYGCWEYNTWLTQSIGYVANNVGVPPGTTTCPWKTADTPEDGVAEMAKSYAANAATYMTDMEAADPAVQIGVPWAFDGTVGGAGVPNNADWDNTLLTDLNENGLHVSFVEAHWYPYGFGGPPTGEDGKPTVQEVIQSVEKIPGEWSKMQAILSADDPGATVTIGETGVSYLATSIPCTPAGALFAAGDALEWLSSGAQTVDWWPTETGENPGTACDLPEEGMFTGNGTPDSAYWGYRLTSQLTQPNAQLSALNVTNVADPGNTSNVIGFQSALPDGQVAVALINADTSYAQKVSISSSLTGNLSTQTYSNGKQNATNSEIENGTTTASAIASSISLPAESITILKTGLPSKVTLAAAATVKAGTKVSISGTLTLNGAAAPAGATVRVYRRVAASSVNSATMTATTGANGAFKVTDQPPAYGHYNYVASYAGTSAYAWTTTSVPVRVTAIRPTLHLKFSAGSVEPGRKVTVIATLAGWHNNRTLVIYAQPKGGARKIIARASANAKGKLVVSYTMKVNTTFTVTYGGDRWYGSGSASGTVKASKRKPA